MRAWWGDGRRERLGFGCGSNGDSKFFFSLREGSWCGAVLSSIDGGEDRGGDGAEGFWRTHACEAEKELSWGVVAALLCGWRQGALGPDP